MKKVMGSLMECMKPRCLFSKNKKKKEQKRRQQRLLHRDERKEPLLKIDQLTLRDCILSSPRSSPSPLPATSNKRVYPNPLIVNEEISMKRLLLEVHMDTQQTDCDDMETRMDYNLSKEERPKKRVSFREPEVADIFILPDSPQTAHYSPDLVQVYEHHYNLT